MARRYFGRIQQDGDWIQELERYVYYFPKQEPDGSGFLLPLISPSEFQPNKANDELVIYDDFTEDGWILENGQIKEPRELA